MLKGTVAFSISSKCVCITFFQGKVDFPRFTFLSITKQDNSISQCSFKLTMKGIKLIVYF